jgi:hypothetical protein
LPQASGKQAALRRSSRRCGRFDVNRAPHVETLMSKNEITERDPDTELQGFEPLRMTLALGALLLGLLLGIH